jgi:hypothetical protein
MTEFVSPRRFCSLRPTTEASIKIHKKARSEVQWREGTKASECFSRFHIGALRELNATRKEAKSGTEEGAEGGEAPP